MTTILDVIRDFFLFRIENPILGFGSNAKGSIEFILIELSGALIMAFIGFRLYKFWHRQKEISNTLFPAMMIVFGLSLRSALTCLDYSVRFMTDQTYGITRSIGTVPAFALVFYYALVLSQRSIRVPGSRMKRLNNLILANKAAIVLAIGSIPFFVIMRSETNIPNIIVNFLVLPILLYMLIQMTREKHDNASKLMQIRMEMYIVGLIGILGFLFMGFALIFTEQIFFTNGWNYALAVGLGILTVSFLVISSLGFYWAFFIPNWLRKRYGLYSPRVFQQQITVMT